MTAVAALSPRKLPVLPMVVVCYGTVVRNLDQLVRIGWLWLLLLLPLYAAAQWLVWTIWATTGLATGGVGRQIYVHTFDVLPRIVELPFLGSIAVGWHRLLLRGERVTGAVYLRLDRVVWRYALVSLALLLIPLIWVVPFLYIRAASQDWEGVALLLSFSVGITWFLIVARVSLVLPAIALGERLSLSGAWHMTRHNSWRLVAANFCGAVPLAVVYGPYFILRDFILPGRGNPISFVIGKLVDLAGNAVFVIFAVTLLSLTYRFFVLEPGESGSPLA